MARKHSNKRSRRDRKQRINRKSRKGGEIVDLEKLKQRKKTFEDLLGDLTRRFNHNAYNSELEGQIDDVKYELKRVNDAILNYGADVSGGSKRYRGGNFNNLQQMSIPSVSNNLYRAPAMSASPSSSSASAVSAPVALSSAAVKQSAWDKIKANVRDMSSETHPVGRNARKAVAAAKDKLKKGAQKVGHILNKDIGDVFKSNKFAEAGDLAVDAAILGGRKRRTHKKRRNNKHKSRKSRKSRR